ncbi:MAG: tetratricopeptide repeat protein [Alphaproteobacteria bacterium]
MITVIDESDNFRDRYEAARRSLNAGAARSALSIYEELLGRQPSDRTALLGRATALHQLNRSGDAIHAYESVLRHHPDEFAALTNLLGLVGQQTPKSALQQLRRLYASNPSFGAVAAQMAMIHLNQGDSANAIRLMTEAAALALDNPVYQINLAIMHDQAGDVSSAVDAYEYALLVAAGSAEVLPLSLDAIRERLRYLGAK